MDGCWERRKSWVSGCLKEKEELGGWVGGRDVPIYTAARSFTLPLGLRCSALAKMRQPVTLLRLLSSTSGVLPTTKEVGEWVDACGRRRRR